jgi:hypothetical protein
MEHGNVRGVPGVVPQRRLEPALGSGGGDLGHGVSMPAMEGAARVS